VKVENALARYEIPIDPFVNKEVVIGVKVVGSNGKDAGWSNFAVIPVFPTPEQPRGLRSESVAGGVRIAWQAKGPSFRVYRRQGDAEFAPVATVQKPEYVDTAVETGKAYDYRVQTVIPFGDKEADSEVSTPLRVVPEDRFPPKPPAGLTVLASPSSIELTWEQSPEPDLAGYRIYRAAPGQEFRRIGETTGIPSFSDRQVEGGRKYRYAVTAFDRGGNESGRSAEVEGALP
jgi:fibronectin type 3 domain-containing protein